MACADGPPHCEGYGLSETSPVAIDTIRSLPTSPAACRLPVPSTEVAILDEDGMFFRSAL